MTDHREQMLRRGYAALAIGDFAAALRDFSPDVVVEDHEYSLASPSIQHGHAGFLGIFAAVNEGFDEVRYTPIEFTTAGDQTLVAALRTGRGTASGVAVEEQQWHLFDFEDGLIVRFRSFLSEDRAREAAAIQAATPEALRRRAHRSAG